MYFWEVRKADIGNFSLTFSRRKSDLPQPFTIHYIVLAIFRYFPENIGFCWCRTPFGGSHLMVFGSRSFTGHRPALRYLQWYIIPVNSIVESLPGSVLSGLPDSRNLGRFLVKILSQCGATFDGQCSPPSRTLFLRQKWSPSVVLDREKHGNLCLEIFLFRLEGLLQVIIELILQIHS